MEKHTMYKEKRWYYLKLLFMTQIVVCATLYKGIVIDKGAFIVCDGDTSSAASQMYILIRSLACSLNGYGIVPLLLSVAVFFLLLFNRHKIISKRMKVTSFCLALLYSTGKYYSTDRVPLEKTIFVIIFLYFITLITIMGGYILFSNLLCLGAYLYQNRLSFIKQNICFNYEKIISNRKYIVIALTAAYVPYLIIRFPAMLTYDMSWAIEQWLGDGVLSDQQPTLITAFYGSFARLFMQSGMLGRCFFLFIPTLIVLLIAVWVMSYSFSILNEYGVTYRKQFCVLLFYMLCPIWGVYLTTWGKDAVYMVVFLLYILLLLKQLHNDEVHYLDYVIMIPVCLVMTLVRSNGMYSFLLSYPLLLLCKGGKKKKICTTSLLLIVLLCNFIISNYLWECHPRYEKAEKIDAFCVMYQQTARYQREYQDEVTQNEREILSDRFDNYDTLGERYMERLADPVKINSTRQFGDYLKIWFQQGMKHPRVYIDAFMENAVYYLYPDAKEYTEGVGLVHSINKCNVELFDFDEGSRNGYQSFMNSVWMGMLFIIRDMPVLGLMFSPGLYTWVTIIMIAMLHKRNLKLIIAIFPSITNILMCTISPTSVLRYALPTIIVTPILLAIIVEESYLSKPSL